MGPTALAPPSSSQRPGQRGGGGEAPPHPVCHRPFKEGDILHINKRGPRERGGPFPEWGARAGGVSGPQNSPSTTRPAWVGKWDFGVGGSWGEGGALKQPGSVSQVRTAAGGEARWDPPPPAVRDRGGGDGRPRGGPERLRIRQYRQAGNGASGAGRARAPHRPAPPGRMQKAGAEPPAPPRPRVGSPAHSPARGKGAVPGVRVGRGGPRPASGPRSSSEAEARLQTRRLSAAPLPPSFGAPRGDGDGAGPGAGPAGGGRWEVVSGPRR